MREKLDSTTDALREVQSQLKERDERAREKEEEVDGLRKTLEETTARADELNVCMISCVQSYSFYVVCLTFYAYPFVSYMYVQHMHNSNGDTVANSSIASLFVTNYRTK